LRQCEQRLVIRLAHFGVEADEDAYDGHILACARKGKCGCLYTFHEKDFLALDDPDIEIVRPSQA